MNAIEMRELSKIYDNQKEALAGVTLSVVEGGLFGFLGPNGAGKTTTIKLLCGLLAPTSGESRVLGLDPVANVLEIHGRCGLLTENAMMYENMTGEENLRFFGDLYGLAQPAGRIRELLSIVGLADERGKVKGYSTGMKKRLSLARVILHQPKLLFLDEPTSGLDPQSAQEVSALILQQVREQGVTVFMCTHQLRYAQDICTHYGLISGGRLLAAGSFDQLAAGVAFKSQVRIRGRLTQRVLDSRWPIHGPEEQTDPGEYQVEALPDQVPKLIREWVDMGAELYQVTPLTPSLEELYFAYIQEGGESR